MKHKIRFFLSVVAVLFFILLPINLHGQKKLSDMAFGVALSVGVVLALFWSSKIPSAIAETYLPNNVGEAWRWAINFALLALLIAIGFGLFLPL